MWSVVTHQAFHDLEEFVEDFDGLTVDAGIISDETYDDGTSVASAAVLQEFGGRTMIEGKEVIVPPRPFLRPAEEDHGNWWDRIMIVGAMEASDGKTTADQVGEDLGAQVQFDIQESIFDVHEPALAGLTIKRRRRRGNRSIKPLIDTGKLLNSIDYKVSRGE